MQESIQPDAAMPDYDHENDQHVFAIDRLVHELRIPAEEVNRSYREVLKELEKEIAVKAFLPALVSISVKRRLAGFC